MQMHNGASRLYGDRNARPQRSTHGAVKRRGRRDVGRVDPIEAAARCSALSGMRDFIDEHRDAEGVERIFEVEIASGACAIRYVFYSEAVR